MTIAWVLGSTGLLGAALCRSLRDSGTELFSPAQRFCWHNELELAGQIAAAVRAFALQVGATDRWEIHWAAGVGTMSSPASALAPETRALSLLLELLQAEPQLTATAGSLSLASSAGAIYAGASDEVITENTAPAPTTAYAEEKLRQEDLVRAFVAANPSTAALIARISTLYGPGQATGKKQGLLGHMARCILRNQPIQIYVPYDTIRDYIDADDAAAVMVGTLRATRANPQVLTKIIASESPATIAEIVSIFKRLARRAPRIVRSANRLSSLYARRVQFRSVVSSDYAPTPAKRLPVGIAQVMMAERIAFTRGMAA
jgi:UDP-glucose 4-epimerase